MRRIINFDEDEELLNLIPLIDCLFILIIFLVTALTFKEQMFKPDEKKMYGIELPESKKNETIKVDDPLVVYVKSNGDYYIEEKKYDADSIDAFFMLKGKTEDKVVVYGDKKCPYEKIVYLTDLARSYGINYIAFYVMNKAVQEAQN
jgi:biopolymer transport protein ExbD